VNRQRGVSSLLMVLLLLALGSLLLQGMNQQQRSLLAQVSAETQAIRETAAAHSALQWGKGLHWPLQDAAACQQDSSQRWRVCLRRFSDASALLIASSGAVQVWQSGWFEQDVLRFSPHGWSDFCPLKEKVLCQMP
jgi:type II secretory pathway component PulK